MYKLINILPNTSYSAARIDTEIAHLAQPFQIWHKLESRPDCLCYVLSNQRTRQSPKLADSKEDDYYKARSIYDACTTVGGFWVLLATMELHVTSTNSSESYYDRTCQLKDYDELDLYNIIGLGGCLFQPFLTLPRSYLLQAELYDSRDPDQLDGGYSNELNEYYRNTVYYVVRGHDICSLSK